MFLMRLFINVLISIFFSVSNASAGSYEDLLAAVKLSDIPAVEALFARGMDVNTTDPDGNTLLIIAARAKHTELAKRLLQRQAALEARNRYGETALMLAAANGDQELVGAMVAQGAKVNLNGWNPLIYAAWQGRTETVKFLLDKGADIDAVSPSGISALMMAAREGHYDTVKLLLWEVANPNIKNDSGATALSWALKAGNTDIAELLKRAGAEE